MDYYAVCKNEISLLFSKINQINQNKYFVWVLYYLTMAKLAKHSVMNNKY
jgi:hypothetical protein